MSRIICHLVSISIVLDRARNILACSKSCDFPQNVFCFVFVLTDLLRQLIFSAIFEALFGYAPVQ